MEPEITPPTDDVLSEQAAALTSLEQRLRLLEEKLASWQNSDGLEERIVERVWSRLDTLPRSELYRSENVTANLPWPVSPNELPANPADATVGVAPAANSWLIGEVLADVRSAFAMWVDHRYRVAWLTQLLLLILLVLIFTSGWWLPLSWIPGIGWFLQKALDLLLAWVVFKVLSREVRRYRQKIGKG